MVQMIRALVTAFTFLTRVPLSLAATNDRDLGRAVGFFPLVGLMLGLVTTGAAYGLAGHLPSPLIAVVVVALLAAVTGALHLDGLADLFDGLAGGRGDRERTLAIMRDSRIGSAGAVALVVLIAAKIAAIVALIEAHDFLSLLAFPVIARWVVTPQIVLFPYSRAEGLGRAFKDQSGPRELVVATIIMAAVAVAVGPAILTSLGSALGISLAMALWLGRRLGGLTGDIYGASIEIAETVALVVAVLR